MYKAQATFFLQKQLEGEMKSGTLPDKMVFIFRSIKENIKTESGIDISMYMDSEFSGETLAQLGLLEHEGVILELVKESQNFDVAVQEFGEVIEVICDNMAFRIQTLIFNRQVKVYEIDVAGQQIGEGYLFPFPHGFQPEKFIASVSLGGRGEVNPILKDVRFDLNSEMTAALRWYHKSLAANFEIDKFVFLFIVCEVLCKMNQVKIKQFYKNQCGHDIENCPTCGATTERIVNGASIKSFLENECGLKPEISKMIWSYRQILHGSNEGFKGGISMAQIRIELQNAVSKVIKGYLGIKEDELPLIDANAPVLANMILTFIK